MTASPKDPQAVQHDKNNAVQKIHGLLFLAAAYSEDSKAKILIKQADSALDSLSQHLSIVLGETPKGFLFGHRATNGLLADLCACSRAYLPAGVELNYSALDGLWPIAIPPAELETAFDNVVLNAIHAAKAQPSGSVAITAVNYPAPHGFQTTLPAGQMPAGDYVRISVVNPGSLSSGMRERLFKERTTSKEQGEQHGLGLLSVTGLLRRWDGAIDLTTQADLVVVDLFLPRAGTG